MNWKSLRWIIISSQVSGLFKITITADKIFKTMGIGFGPIAINSVIYYGLILLKTTYAALVLLFIVILIGIFVFCSLILNYFLFYFGILIVFIFKLQMICVLYLKTKIK